MPTNVLTLKKTMLKENNEIFGKNKIIYMPWSNMIIGAEQNYSNGTLNVDQIKTIDYKNLQEFPDDVVAELLTPASTELPQANVVPTEFIYNRNPVVVQLISSNLQKVALANAEAGIINNLRKKFDYDTYNGSYGNTGVANNPNFIQGSGVAISDLSSLMAATNQGIQMLKDLLGITDNDLGSVLIGYTSKVSAILNANTGTVIARSLFKQAFETVQTGEIPKLITGGQQYLEFYFKPMIEQHHGAMPAAYNRENGEHGLSVKSLFAYETAALRLEEKGTVYRIPITE